MSYYDCLICSFGYNRGREEEVVQDMPFSLDFVRPKSLFTGRHIHVSTYIEIKFSLMRSACPHFQMSHSIEEGRKDESEEGVTANCSPGASHPR